MLYFKVIGRGRSHKLLQSITGTQLRRYYVLFKHQDRVSQDPSNSITYKASQIAVLGRATRAAERRKPWPAAPQNSESQVQQLCNNNNTTLVLRYLNLEREVVHVHYQRETHMIEYYYVGLVVLLASESGIARFACVVSTWLALAIQQSQRRTHSFQLTHTQKMGRYERNSSQPIIVLSIQFNE